MGSAHTFATLAVVVLAAGFSRRMGGEDKLLKSLGGRPVLAHVMNCVESLGFGQIVVVAGANAEAVANLIPSPAALVRNDRAADGMGTSIAAGAAALDTSLRGVFIVLGDMPFVARGDYERIAAAFEGQGERAICVPLADGQRGHPVLFGRAHFPALRRLSGDRGARALLADALSNVREAEGCSGGVLIDLDDAAAFEAAERRMAEDAAGRS